MVRVVTLRLDDEAHQALQNKALLNDEDISGVIEDLVLEKL